MHVWAPQRKSLNLVAENTILKGVWFIFMIEKSHIAKCLGPSCCLHWNKMCNTKPCLTQEYTMTLASSKPKGPECQFED